MTQRRARGASPDPGPASLDAEAIVVLSALLVPTRQLFASLHGAPSSIAEAMVQLLPFGDRIALAGMGVTREGKVIDAEGHRSVVLTPLAYAVMAAAAKAVDQDSAELDELDDARVRQALQRES